MGKLLFSIIFTYCLILVSANVISNHINNNVIGLNHNAVNLNVINATSDKMLGNPVEGCIKKCREEGKLTGGICKYQCEDRHLKRTQEAKYKDCMTKCSAQAQGSDQSAHTARCRANCDKQHPKDAFVY